MTAPKRRKAAAGRPTHGVTAWLASIPRRTVEVVVEHKDPLRFGKFDRFGNPLQPRIEYQGRAARRAYGRRNHVPTPASALVSYSQSATS